jgi:hypothetical protein
LLFLAFPCKSDSGDSLELDGEQVPEESITSVNGSQFLAKGVGSELAWLFSQVRMPGTLSGGGRM